jgi:hypothetical protein
LHKVKNNFQLPQKPINENKMVVARKESKVNRFITAPILAMKCEASSV